MRFVLSTNCAGDIRLQTLRDKVDMQKRAPVTVPPLVCSSQFQELTTAQRTGPAPGFGKISTRNTFTRYAKTLIREAGALLDNGPRECLSFLTGTLPGSTDDALGALAAWSGWVIRTVEQWIRDYAPGALFFGVWEYQKRGALHLHVCVRTQQPNESKLLRARWKERWRKVIDAVSKKSQIDLWKRKDGLSWNTSKWVLRTDAQQVEKSVANYLGKYLSKGSSTARKRCECPPAAWWFCPRVLRAKIRALRHKLELRALSLAAAIDLLELAAGRVAEQAVKVFSYVSPYDVSVKGVVVLASPTMAGAMFRELSLVFGVLAGEARAAPRHWLRAIDKAYTLFDGSRIIQSVEPLD